MSPIVGDSTTESPPRKVRPPPQAKEAPGNKLATHPAFLCSLRLQAPSTYLEPGSEPVQGCGGECDRAPALGSSQSRGREGTTLTEKENQEAGSKP